MNNVATEEIKEALLNNPEMYTQIEAELCLRDFWYFVQTFWDEVCPDPMIYNWHIEYIAREIQIVAERAINRLPKEYDLLINVPPGSSKSMLGSRLLPAWCLAKRASFSTICASYSEELGLEFADDCRNLIKSVKFQKYFPHVILSKTSDNKKSFKTTKNGARHIASTKGTVLGKHADLIVVDDPLKPDEANSETERDRANRFVRKTLPTRRREKSITPMIMIMQRLHEEDPSGMWIELDSNIKHICLPSELDDNVIPTELKANYVNGLLDPKRMTLPVLNEYKIKLGSMGYAGQFLQRPAPEGGSIIHGKWFSKIGFSDLLEKFALRKKKLIWNFTIDGAFTDKEQNDPSALMCYTVLDNQLYIKDVSIYRLEQPDFERKIIQYCQIHGYGAGSRVYIEPKANGMSTAQNLKSRTNLNIICSKAPVTDKISVTKNSAPYIEAGKVYIIDPEKVWVKDFIEECEVFPNGKHDDRVDVLNIAINKAFISNKKFSVWTTDRYRR